MFDLNKEREALIAQIEEFKKDAMELWFVPDLAESYKNMDMFSYSIVENNEVFFMREQARQLWSFWNKAKAQAVPNEIINEIQSWVAVQSIQAMELDGEAFVVGANELAEFIERLVKSESGAEQ
ncbi:hypothetical protein SOI76_12720 [Acinetobacter pittii]|nr:MULTISPECIES: hypothetical protein [Acinetobacter calcoaceticus/baumannii complex]EXC68407.1 hypothetical protein J463_3194 [Acinetobacter baumannii 1043794]EXD91511.1 hypothetical protein J462_1456 [Acinetobacter baumannii 972082]EXE92792.1 hypothetical protein J593_3162 [Acinetobacter baumannii 232184]EXF06716.1 hypothetical protein J600_3226 [Acinetobacter baumannii 268680]EXG94021.1 hypothetical protein J649_3519 [Acinetobacter baumannii 1064293_45]EYT22207.1 hypothetical protein J592_